VFLLGVAELYTPAKPYPGSSQKDGAGSLPYAWPGSPFGNLRAQRLTLPGTPLHIVELLFAVPLVPGLAAAAVSTLHPIGCTEMAFQAAGKPHSWFNS